MPAHWPKCNATEFAALLDVSPQAISQWIDDGMPCKRGRGKGHAVEIDPPKALPWVLARREPPGSQRERLAKEQADKVALENAVKRGELIESSLVADVMFAQAADISSRLDGLPGRMASELAGINDPALIRTRLLDECRDVRAGHAAYIERLADSEAPPESGGGDLPPAEEKVRQPVGRRKSSAPSGKRRARPVAKR